MKDTPARPAAMRSHSHTIEVPTNRHTQLTDITALVENVLSGSGCKSGVCHIYIPHTTAGIMINEGDDPDVARDIEATFDRLIPHTGDYRHAEGNSDSHIKAALTGNSATVFIENGRLALGRWQAIFFCEFDGPRRRRAHVRIVADSAE
jgi:secondary thiamine-phosphate synthase enzyme